ncbi:MAG: glycoside hydrolase family 44 protein [Capsulimonadales bacterium]|nr:glycoside hydrolase family 44 protein [Capsulimonadales bacterium]
MNRRLFIAAATAALLPVAAYSQETPEANFTVDVVKGQPISPYIYGLNFPEWKKIPLKFPVARQGGNRMTAYNWETNASNAGSDWHHQNDSFLGSSDEPGRTVRSFLEDAQSHGAVTILTVPMAGYVAADKKGDGDVNQTPNYLNARFHRSLPKKSGPRVYPPNTADNRVYQDEFVAWIEKIRNPRLSVWYALDNEPDIWAHTHARIVAKTPTYADFIGRSIEYAAAIKEVAPKSVVLGPVSYGWQGFRRFQDAADANNRDFLNVYLAAMKTAEAKHGKRLLDLLDVHFYPEARGDDVRVTEDADKPGTRAARIQAPRSLWDPTYVENSWITQSLGGKPIALLPGLQKQISDHYPGTRLAMTEYNYGGRTDISGTIAQADVLGIFGRYGMYAACNWGMSPDATAQIAAFRAFLDYDGKGGRFGDVGLKVTGETPAEDSLYAARDSAHPDRMTLVAINKTEKSRKFVVRLTGFVPGAATAFVITREAIAASQPGQVSVASGTVTLEAPPLSVTTVAVTR